MATKRIDQLPAATAQTGHDIPAMLAGVTSRVTVASITAGSLPLVGGTLTGDLAISKAEPYLYLRKTATGQYAGIGGAVGASERWFMSLGDGEPETGGNAGSDFVITRSNDAGVYIDPPLTITRATGNVTCGVSLIVTVQGYKPGGGDWATTSDARIKTVLGDYEAGLDEVVQLQPRRYTYKGNDTPRNPHADKATQPPYKGSPNSEAARVGTEFVGLVAQEVETVFPAMVTQTHGFIDGHPVPDLRTLDTTELIYALVNSCKELAARVEALEAATAP